MENYENLGTVGEGAYGIVMKCRNKQTGAIVAIKKFKENDDDEQVRKTALRELRILKQLRHDNIVNLIDVFRRKGKLYLVFEYVESTILNKLEKYPYGLSEMEIKKIMYQLLKGIEYCHKHNIIHRDVKPENLLISAGGALKLCDFGFSRVIEGKGSKYTEYVSTRWYRAPELLVGDREYGKPVDIWAIGCMFAEILNGVPLFPGNSDIDQMYHIINCIGRLTDRQMEIFYSNPLFNGVKLPNPKKSEMRTLEQRFSKASPEILEILKMCLVCDPEKRSTCSELLKHRYFANLEEWYNTELKQIMEREGLFYVGKKKRKKKHKRYGSKEEKQDKKRKQESGREDDRLPDIKDVRSPRVTSQVALPYLNKEDTVIPAITKEKSCTTFQSFPHLDKPKKCPPIRMKKPSFCKYITIPRDPSRPRTQNSLKDAIHSTRITLNSRGSTNELEKYVISKTISHKYKNFGKKKINATIKL